MSRNPIGALMWVLLGIGVLALVLAALTGLLLALVVVVALAVLNLIYLPRAAARLRLTPGWLALILIPFVILIGTVVDGVPGAAWGAGVWLVAIGLPRVIANELGQRIRRQIEARREIYDVATRPAGGDLATRPMGRDTSTKPITGDAAMSADRTRLRREADDR